MRTQQTNSVPKGRLRMPQDGDPGPDDRAAFTAVQEQLKLKLQAQKVVAPTMLIDHVDNLRRISYSESAGAG